MQRIIDDTPRILLRADLCASSADPKIEGRLPPVYVPAPDYQHALKTLSNPAQVREFNAATDTAKFYDASAEHGLLYLPFPYLVPGGRFNEMYGWDMAFPVFAWADTHPKLMREQVDNQLYQIRMYGKVLNANRTYYLSRSQPPLLSAMVMRLLAVVDTQGWSALDPDGLYASTSTWLAGAYRDLSAFYDYWTRGDRRAGDTGLSRYWDDGEVAAPEVVGGEQGHFEHAIAYYSQPDLSAEDAEDAALFLDVNGQLTPLYHRANRAMRASGFDPTGHWGYGALRCVFQAPACLNSFLYRMEGDMAEIAKMLLRTDDVKLWRDRQITRQRNMEKYLFDAQTGAYLDYDFVRKKLNHKPYATLFVPLWAGVYDDQEDGGIYAARAAGYALSQLETPFGIVTSTEESGSQWDAPYGWAPLQYFAFDGLRRYSLDSYAQRVAQKYLDLTADVFSKHNSLFEKYNVIAGNADVHVHHGYDINVSEGGTFLWTAAVVTLAQQAIP